MSLSRKYRWFYTGPSMIFMVFITGFLLRQSLPPGGFYTSIKHSNKHSERRLNVGETQLHAEGVPQRPTCNALHVAAEGEIHFKVNHLYTEQELEVMFPEVKVGGHWSPSNCKPAQELVVIIPFRDPHGDRHKNLMVLIHQLHILLQHQQLGYHIYVIHQNGTSGWFNKGILMNLGFRHAVNSTQATCIVFHDVDVVPVDDRNSYKCGSVPRHLAANINNASGSYNKATGGALCLSSANFKKINGFSNLYWGWGNEDDNLYDRFHHHKLWMIHSADKTGRYLHLKHWRSYNSTNYRPPNPTHHLKEGLNSLDPKHYKLLKVVPHKLYTWFTYHLQQP